MSSLVPAKMSTDAAEEIRRHEVARLNRRKAEREQLEQVYGQVGDTDELCKQFEVLYVSGSFFCAPFVQVRDLDTREKGTLKFQHEPRYYFGWRASHRQRRD